MSDSIDIKVSEGLVKPIIEAKIQAAIVTEMGKDPAALIEALVNSALDIKVNDNGRVSRYNSDNTNTVLGAMVKRVIKEETERAMQEMFEEQRDTIKDHIKKQLMKERGAAKIASAVINGMASSVSAKYGSHVSVTFKTNND